MNCPDDPKPQIPTEASPDAQAPAPADPPSSQEAGKKRSIKLLIGLCITAVVLLLLNLIPFDKLSDAAAGNLSDSLAENTEPVQTYRDSFFKIPDYEENVEDDERYQKLNRFLTFARGGESTAVTAETAKDHGLVCQMFQDYLESLTAGDTAACDRLFTADYLEKNGKHTFAPQKIYDMKVTELRSQVLVNGDANGAYKGYTVSYHEVSYKIMDNNGTLRRDFYRDGDSLPVIFEVLEKDGVAKINGIRPIRSGSATPQQPKGVPIMNYIAWIAVMALTIVIEAASASLTAIWFMPGALVALILALCNVSLTWQLVTFAGLSLVFTLFGLLVVRRHLKKRKPIPTNADRIIGLEGIVTETVDPIAATGEVKVDGKRWSARSLDGTPIEEGTVIKVHAIEGVKLICQKKG